jgi:hypothetical protein
VSISFSVGPALECSIACLGNKISNQPATEISGDRDGSKLTLLDKRTEYDDKTRKQRIDEFILAFDYIIAEKKYEETWDRYGSLAAISRLDVVLDSLIGALFAYNRKWRFFKDREIEFLLRLPWLPKEFDRRVLQAITVTDMSRDGYLKKAAAIEGMSKEIINKLTIESFYGEDPAAEAFIRSHSEPGRAWNMKEWNEKRKY